MYLYNSQDEMIKAIAGRIKPRLKEISLCGVVSKKMYESKEVFDNSIFELGDLKINVGADHRDLTDPIIDTGITMVRVMIQFLGYTVIPENLTLRPYAARKNDITIESFGLALPSGDKEGEDYIFDILKEEEVNAVVEVLMKTNNGVAHLTVNETKSIELNVLALACESVLKLIKHRLLNHFKTEDIKVHW